MHRKYHFLPCSLESCHFWKNSLYSYIPAIAKINYSMYKTFLNLIDFTQIIIILMVAISKNNCQSHHRTNLRWFHNFVLNFMLLSQKSEGFAALNFCRHNSGIFQFLAWIQDSWNDSYDSYLPNKGLCITCFIIYGKILNIQEQM